MALEIHAMFSEDQCKKTDKSIFFLLEKNGNFKSLDHQEKDKLQILKEIVYSVKISFKTEGENQDILK